jgi:hypothetical protein
MSCTAIGSARISPTVMRGLSDAYGSWKMICMWRRIWRIAIRGRAPGDLLALEGTEPPVGSIRRRMRRPVVDLPQPDSPTSASVSPRAMSKLTSSTARTCRHAAGSRRADREVLDQPRTTLQVRRRRCSVAVAVAVAMSGHAALASSTGAFQQATGARAEVAQRRWFGVAARIGERAARREAAARRLVGRAGHRALDGGQAFALDVQRGIEPSRPIVYGCCGSANSASTGALSTIWPAYITITSSASSAITPRSWVMIRIAMPSRCCRSRSRSRICAWIVTSSAVVGSSAISSAGLAGQRHGDHHPLAHAAGQ